MRVGGGGFSSFFGVSTLHAVYADAEYGFVLCDDVVRMKPVALVTFDIAEDEGRPLTIVRQLQGVKGRAPSLRGIRWERMFLTMVVDWARTHGHGAVACIQGRQSRWAYHDAFRSFRMRYDVSAKRNGFRLDERLGLWRLPLVSS
jgi:hypothetical protein